MRSEACSELDSTARVVAFALSIPELSLYASSLMCLRVPENVNIVFPLVAGGPIQESWN